ncbi:ubiquitin-associated protein 2-like [Labrus mixtus]|uniref:ubiquitin-associated protein 2-like n=1 Tax=Labrus mixtus TaxID=508554 RepID=UPI0029C076D4|nr:ubiquitin-associated protein 2-like [Labrus mixtus]
MMTSVVSNQSRGTRDKMLPTTTQTTQPQKQIQATAEQIRLAQMIYDKNDADFEDKVKQLIEVTGKTQDECMVALHDCNEDVNRAINFLLESTSDTNSWETVGKKRNIGKEGGPSEIKDSREKRGLERETSRGRGGSNRRGRGISRGREGRVEENGFEVAPGERRGDPGRRGRGRGTGTRGRGRAAAGNRFSTQGMGIFNPADYSANSGNRQETWEGDGNEHAEGAGTWTGNVEDWTSEDWNEDLSETKVFTASSAPVNHITPGQNVDLASLLPKAGMTSMDSDLGVIVDGPSAEDLGQSLVFTNSHHNGRTATHSYAHATANSYAHAASAGTTYAHAALSSVLGSGFGSLNAPKPTPSSDMRTSEQLNGPRLGQRVGQTLATTSNSNVSKDAGPPPIQNPAPAPSPSVDVKPQRVENGPVTAQHLEMKLQPEPSAVLSQLAQRQQQSSILPTTEPLGLSQSHAPQVPTPPGHESSIPPMRDGASPGAKLPGMEPPITEAPQRQLKAQRRRVPPPSKIPSSAVEMPGSADIPGLNLQFGALDFGPEAGSGTVDMAQAESAREQAPAQAPAPAAPAPMSVTSTVPIQQPQSSLFSKPGTVSDHMSSLPPAVSDPSFPSPSVGLPSATPSPSLGLPSAAAPPSSSAPTAANRVESSGPRTLPPHLGYSQSKDIQSAVTMTNGYSGMKTQSTQDSKYPQHSTRTVKTESPVMTSDSGPSHHIPSPAVTPSHSTAMMSLNSHVTSTHSSGSALPTSSSLTISHEDSSSANLHAFSSSSSQVVNPSPAPQAVSSLTTNGLHLSGAPGLTPNGSNATLSAAVSRTAPLLTATSGKAPPNLAQGVPPLLANQYIMGPGGLLPAYPQIYGYEDLQMLQSRLPMDYYGVTFPGTTAAMPGRDGLANNPYTGEATKFGRNDASSPAPPTSLSTAGVQSQAQQAPQAGSQGQGQGQSQGQQAQNQAFLNPPLPPGYGYTGLPYYAGMPGVPSAFQYGPTVFVPPASAKQQTMGLANPSNQYHQQHQPSYGQHAYSTAFDDLSQAHGGEYSKGGYGGSAQSQAKSAGSGPGKAPGLSGSGTGGGVPDMGGSIYSKTQSFDKQGFHTGTPPPFSLPSALGGTGPLNPGGAPGYAPAPFLHILPPHQQPHSQLLHHHLTQDGQGGPGQRGASSSMQQKTQGSKSSYGSSPYWAN